MNVKWDMRGFKITCFEMIAVSFDVRIEKVFILTAIRARLNNAHAFGHCVIFSGNI